jgi:hypothetical protein
VNRCQTCSVKTGRRGFLRGAAAAMLLSAARSGRGRAAEAGLPPLRAITRGPKFHWFAYYDKLQFDPTGRYALGMESSFDDRDVRAGDAIRVGMVDLEDGDRWIELGASRAWCWQQGCMLQWRPGSAGEILWNDREGDRWVCRILDVKSGRMRTVPQSVYAVSPDGKTAATVDYGRLGRLAPGYGYFGVPDRSPHANLPDDNGIWRVDLNTGESSLILSIRQVAQFGRRLPGMTDSPMYLKHLLFSPDGSRLVFLQRWYHLWPQRWPRYTRMLTANPDGSGLRVVDDNGYTSHFNWRDPRYILAWSDQKQCGQRFYLFPDGEGKIEAVGREAMTEDGHCSYLPNKEWILCDTYPDARRLQHVYLFHVPTGRRLPLGHFLLPPRYDGVLRIDTHPRFSPDGRKVVIDAAQGASGRQMLLIDVARIVAPAGPSG